VYTYVSPDSNIKYKLNTDMQSHFAAQQWCLSDGGFLVSYADVYEQVC
jgi:hypothetical protein